MTEVKLLGIAGVGFFLDAYDLFIINVSWGCFFFSFVICFFWFWFFSLLALVLELVCMWTPMTKDAERAMPCQPVCLPFSSLLPHHIHHHHLITNLLKHLLKHLRFPSPGIAFRFSASRSLVFRSPITIFVSSPFPSPFLAKH